MTDTCPSLNHASNAARGGDLQGLVEPPDEASPPPTGLVAADPFSVPDVFSPAGAAVSPAGLLGVDGPPPLTEALEERRESVL